jgi:hypothetical protein
MRTARLALLLLPAALAPAPARAQLLGAQINVIGQRLVPVHSPYAGALSLRWWGDDEMSQSFGVYLGARLPAGLQAYLDVEMIRGNGVSGASGLAGVTNGDVVRQGTVDLGKNPYVARAFLRWTISLGAPVATRWPGRRTRSRRWSPRTAWRSPPASWP